MSGDINLFYDYTLNFIHEPSVNIIRCGYFSIVSYHRNSKSESFSSVVNGFSLFFSSKRAYRIGCTSVLNYISNVFKFQELSRNFVLDNIV